MSIWQWIALAYLIIGLGCWVFFYFDFIRKDHHKTKKQLIAPSILVIVLWPLYIFLRKVLNASVIGIM
jgi:hypothetical protein